MATISSLSITSTASITTNNSDNTNLIYDNLIDSSYVSSTTDSNTFINFSYNSQINTDNIVSIVIYTDGVQSVDNGILFEIKNNATVKYSYEIFSSSNIYRFDNINNLELPGIFGNKIDFFENRIVDISTNVINSIHADVDKISLYAMKTKWKPLNKIVYRNNQFVAVGDRTILLSNDGINWKGYPFDYINDENEQNFFGIEFRDTTSNNNEYFLAIARNGYNINWNPTSQIESITFNNNYQILNTNEIYQTLSSYNNFFYGNNIFIAVGNGYNLIHNSLDWSTTTITYNILDITVFDTHFYAITSNGKIIKSPGGEVWEEIATFTNTLTSIKTLQNQMIITGNNVIIYGIEDNWNIINVNNILLNSAFVNINYIAVSDNSNILINDGIIENSYMIGLDNTIAHSDTILIGNNILSTKSKQIILGNENTDIFIPNMLGIGTSDPNSKLHVIGDINIGSTGTLKIDDDIIIENMNNSITCDIYANLRVIRNTSRTDGLYIGLQSEESSTAHTRFFAGSNNEIMRLDASNNYVGIGTMSPTNKLQITDGTCMIEETGSNNNSLIINPNNHSNGVDIEVFQSDNSTIKKSLCLNPNGGNIGIGTTSPQTALHIQRTGDAIFRLEADSDNVDETHNPVIELIQDGGIIRSYFGNTSGSNALTIGTSSDNIIFSTKGVNSSTIEDLEQRMVITDTGNVGIGITNPTNKLTIHGTNSDTVPILGLRSGNNADVFNNGAQIAFGYAGTNTYQHFINTRHSHLNTNNAIDFYVSDGTTNNTVTSGSIHNMSLVSGKVGIGTTDPYGKLDIGDSAETYGGSVVINNLGDSVNIIHPTKTSTTNIDDPKCCLFLGRQGTGGQSNPCGVFFKVCRSYNSGVDSLSRLDIDVQTNWNSTANVMKIQQNSVNVNGEVTAPSFNATSDLRLKENIKPLENSLNKICSLEGVEFKFKNDENKMIGFIAQEVEKIVPEVVNTANDEEKYKSIAYGNVTALLVEAIKELRQEVNDLRSQIEILKN